MPKIPTRFVCQQCGAESQRWMGRCAECGEWNSLVEQQVQQPAGGRAGERAAVPMSRPMPVSAVGDAQLVSVKSGIEEFDRVLGGGLVAGSAVLLAGDPGVGKSTLLLQALDGLASHDHAAPCLYVSAEESLSQLRLRSQRLGISNQNLLVAAETEVEALEAHIADLRPAAAVMDSIQAVFSQQLDSGCGSVSQIRFCAGRLIRLAKESGAAVFLVGHVTKEGAIAGPRVLEHMVDTVLYLEGERHLQFRLLRAVKNRFGSTNELGVFEMHESGMQEVPNASAAFLLERQVGRPGSAVVATIEGSRPLLVEIQGLVSPAAAYGNPRRSVTGLDHHRASLVMAVLEKKARIALGQSDVFVNLPGGVMISEPACDLGIAVALASSAKDRPVRPDTVCFGEVGLTGEVRAVSQPERRVSEAARLGFSRCIVPRMGWRKGSLPPGAVPAGDLAEAFQQALEG